MDDKGGSENAYKESNALLSDIIMNYRTVIGFGPKNIQYLLSKYEKLLEAPNAKGIRNAHIGGIAFGYTNCIRYIFQGLIFYLASIIIYKYHEKAEDEYISVYLLFMSALGSGMQIQNAPSSTKAKVSASKIFTIIDEPSKIDVRSSEGFKTIDQGEIEF